MTTQEKIIKARINLLIQQPFFGQLILKKMQLQECSDIPTAAVDGRTMLYNPAWIDTLSFDHLKGVLCHEVLHLAQLHHTRRGNRDPRRWNMATDYAINPIVLAADLTLPAGALVNPAYNNMSAEEIYNLLPPGDGSGSGDGSDPGGTGIVTDFPGESESEKLQEEQETKIDGANAAKAAKMQGKLPSSLARLVEELTEPRVPWREVLQRFITTSLDRSDYSFRRPNRRYPGQIIMPGLIGEALPPVYIAVDTSGSIGAEDLQQFASEIDAVLDCFPTTIHVIYCDARIQHRETFTRDARPVRLEAKGGGGTDFRPVFDLVDSEGQDFCCVVYLTDMYGTFPPAAPGYPVLWVSTSGEKAAPFGEVVRLEG